ncbi:MAG: type I phosphomannose isomerase catalytic subunit [Acidobacteriaceae bacterium]
MSPWYDHKPVGEPVGEAWLSGDDCIVDDGPLAGQKFSAVFAQHREALLGPGSEHAERFPLLMKVLFPREKLSVQVHPDDAMARKHGEPHGKTECWYALDAAPDAAVALGLQAGTTQAAIQAAIESHTLEDLLRWVPVKKGDMIFVDAGTVHAIGPGVTLLETQQNSDMTYRLYDYGRPRELHLEHGMQAVRLQTDAGKVGPRTNGNKTLLIQSKYFRVDRYALLQTDVAEAFARKTRDGPGFGTVELVFVACGSGRLESKDAPPVQLHRGGLAVVPACVPEWSVTPSEPMEILRVLPQ